MVTSFGEVVLKFVTLITLFQFALPWMPSTRCGNTIACVDVDAGSAFKTASEGPAIKSWARTIPANLLSGWLLEPIPLLTWLETIHWQAWPTDRAPECSGLNSGEKCRPVRKG